MLPSKLQTIRHPRVENPLALNGHELILIPYGLVELSVRIRVDIDRIDRFLSVDPTQFTFESGLRVTQARRLIFDSRRTILDQMGADSIGRLRQCVLQRCHGTMEDPYCLIKAGEPLTFVRLS